MLLTPPDVFSQTLLALPVWGLFELGLICCRFLPKKEDDYGDDELEDDADDESEDTRTLPEPD